MADNLSIQGHAHAADTETPASVVKPPALALGPIVEHLLMVGLRR